MAWIDSVEELCNLRTKSQEGTIYLTAQGEVGVVEGVPSMNG